MRTRMGTSWIFSVSRGEGGRICAMSTQNGVSGFRWLPAVIMMGLIFMFSSLPNSRVPYFGQWDLLIKKGGHALGFGMLGLAYAYALPSRLSRSQRWLLSILMVVLFALSDEFHQFFVEGRNSSLVDVLIDTAGAMIMLTLGLAHSSNSSSKSTS
jgi:VanZ family protein